VVAHIAALVRIVDDHLGFRRSSSCWMISFEDDEEETMTHFTEKMFISLPIESLPDIYFTCRAVKFLR
jgi:hypothetical protein